MIKNLHNFKDIDCLCCDLEFSRVIMTFNYLWCIQLDLFS